jgi:flavin-dependent dehydrogenase
MPKDSLPVVIAGAGPAGSSLAVRLRMLGLPVVLIERYRFPREKLCGEFISPECLEHFRELGVIDEMLAAGGDRILETRFFETRGRSVRVPSGWLGTDGFALSLSRARMDEILLNRARELGADVREGTSVVGLIHHENTIAGVRARSATSSTDEVPASFTVDATGRARVLCRFLEKGNAETVRPKFIGLKAHLSGAQLPRGACEIYAFRGGYAGLSHVEGGFANLCLIAKASLLAAPSAKETFIERLKDENLRARETLCSAVKDHEWLTVSIPKFGLIGQPDTDRLIAVGDSAAFIDPFTGSGMLMAMESAKLLSDVARQHQNDLTTIEPAFAREYERRFRVRLTTSGWLRHTAYVPFLSSAAVRVLSLSESLRSRLARRTRSV